MKVSVIVPAYNAEHSIQECINSLLNQKTTYDFEIIIVDDGSKDRTAGIAKSFKKVKVFSNKNSGPASARNFGARKAIGEIIIFIDSDCVADKNWLQQMTDSFKDKEVVGVQGAYRTKQKELMARFTQIEIEHRYERLKNAKKVDWIGSYSAGYKKEIFLKEHGFSKDFKMASGEDPELSYKLSKKNFKLKFNPNAIVFHKHPTSLPEYLRKKFVHAFWRVLLYKKHSDKAISDSYTPQSLKLQILLVLVILALAVLGLVFPIPAFMPWLALFLLVLSFVPFFLFALARDFSVALVSPVILALRSISFVLGLFMGFIKGILRGF